MFKVKANCFSTFATDAFDIDKIYTIYDVRTDNAGYPQFLIYLDNQWNYMSAKYFKPIEEEE